MTSSRGMTGVGKIFLPSMDGHKVRRMRTFFSLKCSTNSPHSSDYDGHPSGLLVTQQKIKKKDMLDQNGMLHTLTAQHWTSAKRSYERRQRHLDRRYVTVCRRDETKQLSGDAVLARVYDFLNNAFSHAGKPLKRSLPQIEMHQAYIEACLAKIYQDDFAQNRDAILRKLKIEGDLRQEVLVVASRRAGKTFGVAMFVAAMALSVHDIEISIFATCQDISSKMLAQVKIFLEQGLQYIGGSETWKKGQDKQRRVSYFGPDGSERIVGAYPSSSRVSRFLFLFFLFLPPLFNLFFFQMQQEKKRHMKNWPRRNTCLRWSEWWETHSKKWNAVFEDANNRVAMRATSARRCSAVKTTAPCFIVVFAVASRALLLRLPPTWQSKQFPPKCTRPLTRSSCAAKTSSSSRLPRWPARRETRRWPPCASTNTWR